MPSAPLSLIAEITHRCPLHCVYCSNPLEMKARGREISTEAWARVFQEAAGLGTLQLHLTGGEPLARPDLTELVAAGRGAKLYVNVITSGLGLDGPRLQGLVDAGLDHIQLSFQDAEAEAADRIAGTRAHARKLEIARLIKSRRVAFTVNMVVHRQNLDRLPEMIALAEQLQADRIEIANVQYYGWALENREALLPTRAQLQQSVAVVEAARQRLNGSMRIDFVVPDYYARYPKTCSGGWAQRAADRSCRIRSALSCSRRYTGAAVRQRLRTQFALDLGRVRGFPEVPRNGMDARAMPELRTARHRSRGLPLPGVSVDGNADATDPTCSLAPGRVLIEAILERVNAEVPPVLSPSGNSGWVYRVDPANA